VRRAIVRVVLALLTVCLVFGGYVIYEGTRFVVTVRNESQGATATNIELILKSKHTDQHVSIKQLAPGDSESLTSLKPSGDSALDVRFKIGGEACHHLNEYVEANGGGYRIEVAIRSCTDVRSHNNLWPSGTPWFRAIADLLR